MTNLTYAGMSIHCKDTSDTNCQITNPPEKITSKDCRKIAKTFDNDTILNIAWTEKNGLACGKQIQTATYNASSKCPHQRLFF